MAYGKNSKGEKLLKKKLLDKYTHLGSTNFVSYAYRVAQEMDSKTIKQQLANHSKILNLTIDAETNKRLAFLKHRRGKIKDRLK